MVYLVAERSLLTPNKKFRHSIEFLYKAHLLLQCQQTAFLDQMDLPVHSNRQVSSSFHRGGKTVGTASAIVNMTVIGLTGAGGREVGQGSGGASRDRGRSVGGAASFLMNTNDSENHIAVKTKRKSPAKSPNHPTGRSLFRPSIGSFPNETF